MLLQKLYKFLSNLTSFFAASILLWSPSETKPSIEIASWLDSVGAKQINFFKLVENVMLDYSHFAELVSLTKK